MHSLRWAIAAALLLVGCGKTEPARTPTTPNPPVVTGPSTTPSGTPTADAPPAADNTGVNKRDANDTTQTPVDQSERAEDVDVTARIRRRVVDVADFSVNAQNVKIITENGVITLRGPVATASEKERIVKFATEEAGTAFKVVDQLEVTP